MFFNTSFGVRGNCGTAPFEKKLLCNIWVYCPPNEKRDGKCWTGTFHDHEQHECWLKIRSDPAENPFAPSSRRYPDKHLQEHKTSPDVVQWLSVQSLNRVKWLLLEILIGGWPPTKLYKIVFLVEMGCVITTDFVVLRVSSMKCVSLFRLFSSFRSSIVSVTNL